MLFKIINNKKCNIKNFCKLQCQVGKLPRLSPFTKCSWKTTNSIRESFIEYFKKSNHKYVEPCSVNNKNNGSYFVNSGVSQFKDHILGKNTHFHGITKAVNSQRCIRLGGKKCDLESVGYDSVHLSYFEMLGNWSFREYNKKEACKMMWQYLTEVLGLPASHLYVTYFGGCDKLGLKADDETRDIWFSLGLKDSKILQFGAEHNFWEMGDRETNALCGPSTEIHWDYLATLNDGDNPRCARCFVNSSSPEVVELWNGVFIQYSWAANGTRLAPIPGLVIDTGMGLERLASVVQGVTDVFDTDNFSQIINRLSDLSGAPKYEGTFAITGNAPISARSNLENQNVDLNLRRDIAYRIIADNLRALCICVHDGIQPGRQDVELKVRHLLHRAIRQSRYGLGMSGSLHPIIDTIYDTLHGQIEVNSHLKTAVKEMIEKEEQSFLPKLEKYEKTFEKFLSTRQSNDANICDEEIKHLVSGSFGYPMSLDMIRAMSKDKGLLLQNIPIEEFIDKSDANDPHATVFYSPNDLLMNKNIPITDSRSVHNYTYNKDSEIYETKDIESVVLAVLHTSPENSTLVAEVKPFDTVTRYGLITSHTNMYAMKGGQDSDKGVVLSNGQIIATISSVVELKSGHIIHWCSPVESAISQPSPFSKVTLRVDSHNRTGTTLHHTAHHIVFAAINRLVGRIHQSSSSVKFDHARLCFTVDLSHGDPTILKEPDFPEKLEIICNNIIKNDTLVEIKENMDFSSIIKDDIIRYVKSEKLPNRVRVISIGDTGEVCCGTHAFNTGHLRNIAITSLRRANQAIAEISFVTGEKALDIRRKEKEYLQLCEKLKGYGFVENEEMELLLAKLNHGISSELLSKPVRNLMKKSADAVLLRRNKPRSIAAILQHELSTNQPAEGNLRIVYSEITSMKKIVQTISDMKLSSPFMIYDKAKVLIYMPQRNAIEYVPLLLENVDPSLSENVSETPQVKNVSENILRQFSLLTFLKELPDENPLETNFKNIVEKTWFNK